MVLTNVITPRLGLRPQYWWPGLGVVGGFVTGIGMAGPGFGVLALESFRYFWVKVTTARYISTTVAMLMLMLPLPTITSTFTSTFIHTHTLSDPYLVDTSCSTS